MRILVADDDRAVLASYRAVFAEPSKESASQSLTDLAAELFADDGRGAGPVIERFDVTYVTQGVTAVEAVAASLSTGNPFQVLFLDMRMPPGIDGKESARRIRALDPDLNIVLVTGYSDSTPLDVAAVAGPVDKLYYVVKPFEADEILQIARALSEKWRIEADLKRARASLEEQVVLLKDANLRLAASETRAQHIAFHDSLTGAPNRAAFTRELVDRQHAGDFAVAILDLDRFKSVNDTLGHAAGDELIRSVWHGLHHALPEGAMAARLGGDEFGIILPFVEPERTASTCSRFITVCENERSVFGNEIQIGASIGVAFAESTLSHESIDLLRRADLALYAAKRAGRGRVRLFDASLDESVRFRRRIETGLRTAIATDQLSLAFQPIVRQKTLETVGFEALVRWQSAEFGMVPPSMFIPIAEEGSLIFELGDWVLRNALAACRTWDDRFVSINLSPRQFRRPQFVADLAEHVSRAGLTADRVQLEITETALFDDLETASERLAELRRLGYRVALDDFGTGYSSLFNLKSFSIDCIKIDRSFVESLGREESSTAIVSSITQLARSLGLTVVAEGVEDQFQQNALLLAGCSHMQGYRFGRPVSAEDTAVSLKVDRSTQRTALG